MRFLTYLRATAAAACVLLLGLSMALLSSLFFGLGHALATACEHAGEAVTAAQDTFTDILQGKD